MQLNAHFYLLNDDFSPEYAEANHGGEESENNPRYEWEDEVSVSVGLEKVAIERKGVYTIQGETVEGPFSYDIPETFLVQLHMTDGNVGAFAISESIMDSFTYDESQGELKVYIKDYEPFSNPIPGVYIASKEFPKPLTKE